MNYFGRFCLCSIITMGLGLLHPQPVNTIWFVVYFGFCVLFIAFGGKLSND